MNRPTIQAYRRSSGRFCVPRPASYVLEVQGRQTEIMGVQCVDPSLLGHDTYFAHVFLSL